MNVVPFRPYHIDLLIAQGVQKQQLAEVSLVSGAYANLPRLSGMAMTVMEEDGYVILCGGTIQRTPTTGELWALLSENAGRHFIALTRAVRRFIDLQPYRRLEVTAANDFPAGCRWLTLLGFSSEGPCRGYGPNGEDHTRYARVRT